MSSEETMPTEKEIICEKCGTKMNKKPPLPYISFDTYAGSGTGTSSGISHPPGTKRPPIKITTYICPNPKCG